MFSLTICINLISYGQGCGTSNLNSYDDLIPDLYPTRTVRVALHIVHENSISDNTMIDNNSLGEAFLHDNVANINHYLKNLSNGNYFSYGSRKHLNAKLQIELHAIHHHVNADLNTGILPNGDTLKYWQRLNLAYDTLIKNNTSLSTYEKEHVLPVY